MLEKPTMRPEETMMYHSNAEHTQRMLPVTSSHTSFDVIPQDRPQPQHTSTEFTTAISTSTGNSGQAAAAYIAPAMPITAREAGAADLGRWHNVADLCTPGPYCHSRQKRRHGRAKQVQAHTGYAHTPALPGSNPMRPHTCVQQAALDRHPVHTHGTEMCCRRPVAVLGGLGSSSSRNRKQLQAAVTATSKQHGYAELNPAVLGPAAPPCCCNCCCLKAAPWAYCLTAAACQYCWLPPCCRPAG